jgi:hypothetical protein
MRTPARSSEDREGRDEERRTREWLARYGQAIADAMFRASELFYEDDLRRTGPSGIIPQVDH